MKKKKVKSKKNINVCLIFIGINKKKKIIKKLV